MLPILERKLLRELRQIVGQAAAIVLVVGCAVATAVMSFGVLRSLDQARAQYYERSRFADLFVSLHRAPEAAADAIRRIPGVAGIGLVEPGLRRRAIGLRQRLEFAPRFHEIIAKRRRRHAGDDGTAIVADTVGALDPHEF